MIHPESIDRAQGRKSFPKRSLNTISLKCESELRGFHVRVDFTIAVGSEQRGPMSHNFSARSVGELSPNERLWDLKAARDSNSMTIAIVLEALPHAEIDRNGLGIAQDRHVSYSAVSGAAGAPELHSKAPEKRTVIAHHRNHGDVASSSKLDSWRFSKPSRLVKPTRLSKPSGAAVK
jgi:hypothetical protein